MNKVAVAITGTALVAVLGFMQAEIEVIHDDVQEVRQLFIQRTGERLTYTQSDLDCMAKNIYHEAGIEPLEGKFAVAQVTLNRLRSGRWGNSICSVVYAHAQFSWTLYRKTRNEVPRGPLWDQSRGVARSVLDHGTRVPSLQECEYYHADYINNPLWAKSVVKIQQVGQHIFYKKV